MRKEVLLNPIDFHLLRSEISSLNDICIIITRASDSNLIDETVNFLVRTGIPKLALREILIRNGVGEIFFYRTESNPELTDCDAVSAVGTQEDHPLQKQPLYFLFITAGAKISWGSIDCLHRAAVATPDAAVISAVFRNVNGRIVLPKQRRSISSFWTVLKRYFSLQNLEVIQVTGFFQEALLMKSNAVDIMSRQTGLSGVDFPFSLVNGSGHFVCVLSAQLISLGPVVSE